MEFLFFELIQITVGNIKAFSVVPSAEDWESMFREAQRQTIAGWLFPSLSRLPKEQHPPKRILLNWHTQAEKIHFDNAKANKDAIWASKKFALAGFRNAILKGQGNALLYPDPMLRNSGDVDIWLEGNRKEIIDYVRNYFPKERVQWLEINFPIKKDTVIEVHTTPSILFNPWDNRKLQLYYQQHEDEIFKNDVKLSGNGMIQVPTQEVNLVFQLSHIYRHLFFEGVGLRQVTDYFYLIKNSNLYAKNSAIKIIQEVHMSQFCGALMWILGYVFGMQKGDMLMEPDEQEGRFLLQEIMLAGNFGHDDNRIGKDTSKWGNFWQITNRNWKFLTRYPREIIWNPIFRITQFMWRIKNGYK